MLSLNLPTGPGSSPQLQEGKLKQQQSRLHAAAAPLRPRIREARRVGSVPERTKAVPLADVQAKSPDLSHRCLPGLPMGFSGGSDGKKKICLQCRKPKFDPWVRKIPWSRWWQPTPVFLSGESQGQRSLASHSPWQSQGIGHDSQFPMFSKGGFRTWKSIFPAEKLQQIHIRWGWGAGSAGVWCWERTAFISHTLGKKDWLLDVEAVPPEASVTGPRSRSYQESDWEWHSNLSDTQAQGNNHCDLLSPCQGAFPNNLPSDWGIGYNTFSPDHLGKWKRKLPVSYASPLWSHTLYISVTDHWLKKEWGVRGRDLYDSKAVFLKTFISWISEEISMENQGIGSWDQEFTI